jgi:DNA repair protein RadC
MDQDTQRAQDAALTTEAAATHDPSANTDPPILLHRLGESSADLSSDATADPNAAKPHYHGHRQRLRDRYLGGGADAMPDYELIELLLFAAVPRRDVKPIAKRLIDRFGSLAKAVNADMGELKSLTGLSETSLITLKIVKDAALRMAKQQAMTEPLLNTWDRLLDYVTAAMAHEKTEQLRLIFLNKRSRLIAEEVQQRGTIDHTPAYPREVVQRALELGASALVLAHNHPSGDPTPSRADIEMTKTIKRALSGVNIALHDHLIVTRSRTASFKSLGLL